MLGDWRLRMRAVASRKLTPRWKPKVALPIAAVRFLATPLWAQRWSVGASGELAVPTGWFSGEADPGVGGNLALQYKFGRTVEMIGTFGYTSWQGNDEQEFPLAQPVPRPPRSATLVEIGVKVYTGGRSLRPYAMGLVGWHNVTRDATRPDGRGGYKATLPSVAPGLGLEVPVAQRMWLDVSGRFRSVFNLSPIDSSSNEPSWHMLAFRLGVLIRI